MSNIVITGFSVGERAIEIGYSEHHDRGDHAVLIRTIMIERDLIENLLAELLELLEEIVDIGITDIHKQPDTIPFKAHR